MATTAWPAATTTRDDRDLHAAINHGTGHTIMTQPAAQIRQHIQQAHARIHTMTPRCSAQACTRRHPLQGTAPSGGATSYCNEYQQTKCSHMAENETGIPHIPTPPCHGIPLLITPTHAPPTSPPTRNTLLRPHNHVTHGHGPDKAVPILLLLPHKQCLQEYWDV